MGLICFFNTAIAWGGGEKWHFDTSRHLHQLGYTVLVIAHTKSELLKRLIAAEIPHRAISISNLSFLNPFKWRELKSMLKRYPVDTLIMNLSRDVKIAGPCGRSSGINRIIYRRGSAIPIKNTFLNRYFFKNIITDVLANSEATKKTVLENNAELFPQEKIKVIYNGIEIPKEILSRNYPTNKNQPFTIINLGRLEAQKNQEFLIYVAQELKRRNITFKMIIGGEGRLKKTLKEKVKELSMQEFIEFAGFIEHPLAFMAKGDIFVLHSLWEGFGYVLAEASISKKPIVAFDISSNPELVIDGKTGFLVAPNNIETFADAIEKLYRDERLREKMGANGSQYASNHFSKEDNLEKIKNYLIYG